MPAESRLADGDRYSAPIDKTCSSKLGTAFLSFLRIHKNPWWTFDTREHENIVQEERSEFIRSEYVQLTAYWPLEGCWHVWIMATMSYVLVEKLSLINIGTR